MTGDYSMKATSGLLMAKGSEGHPTERTDLFTKRLVAAHESEQGHRLMERGSGLMILDTDTQNL